MSDTVEIETIEQKPSALVKIVETSGLEKTKADFILEKFQDYFKIASEWESKAKMLLVTSDTQITEMKMAREGRLFLKQKRVDIEKARKELKEQSLREGKAIDGIANVLKALIEPVEQFLDEQERFVEIREDKAKEVRKSERIAEIQSLGLDPVLYDLKNMPDENYKSLVSGQRLAIQQKIDADKKAEEERLERERENERIRIENERLRKESEEKEKALAVERAENLRKEQAEREAQEKRLAEQKARAESERKAIEEKSRNEREASEKKLLTEKQERERLEKELKDRADKEASELKARQLAEKKAQCAPDKTKLIELAKSVDTLSLPELKSDESKKILSDTKGLLKKVSAFIREKTEQL